MHLTLEKGLDVLGIRDEVPSLDQAAADSERNLASAQAWLHNAVPPNDKDNVDVVVLGSYARQEASGESDFDYLVIPHGLTPLKRTRQLIAVADSYICEELETMDGSSKKPGWTGLFGTITAAADMTERIGLEFDTNLSHSRRVLLIEESVSIYRPELHEALVRAIFERYLADYNDLTKPGPPRFLLNDIIRYWYTLAVDYQAKRWEGNNSEWGLRYLKLLSSRRLSYAGALVPLLVCDAARPVTPEYLLDEFGTPPLARLARLALLPEFDQHDAPRKVLLSAEAFSAFLAQGDKREEVRRVQDVTDPSPIFVELRENADRLAESLREVFFQSFLRERALEYLVF